MIVCPKCKQILRQKDHTFYCENNHSYDIAKQGYVNLMLGNQKKSGDNALMIQARHAFLNKGYYACLKDALIELLQPFSVDFLVDIACGEGYYTKCFSQVVNHCVGIDLSKEALKIASKHDKKTLYTLASIFDCPIKDEQCDAITHLFAPTPLTEIERCLKKEGIYIRVVANVHHLEEMKAVLYESIYLNKVDVVESNQLSLIKTIDVSDQITLPKEDIETLFSMTPYYWKTPKLGSEALRALDKLTTTIAFQIQVYQKTK